MSPEIEAGLVVNAAGLSAQSLARSIAGMPADKIPPLHLAKGNYFSFVGRAPFSHLIYPMPAAGGLGVHLTLDLAVRRGSGRTSNGWRKSTVPSTRGARIRSTPRSEPIGRDCRRILFSPLTPASGRRSPGPAPHRPIS
jgi:hypothetical protein